MTLTYEELADGIETIVPSDGLKEKLALAEKENRPLIIKFGMDPTAPDLHLGHAVGLKKLRQFQEAGHEIWLLVGDFTAQIGDPTGRNTTRPPLTREESAQNAQTYIDQMDKVIDTKKNVHIVFNGDWLNKISLSDFIKLLGKSTLAQILQRDDFAKRFEANIPISLHELIYPMLQGYDSVVMKADIEFGGRDQLFNCLVGRELQLAHGQQGQTVISMPLLRGLDGEMKMSKSKGNYIGLTESADVMFGKTMSIPDELLEEWIELTTDWSRAEKDNTINALKNNTSHPMDIKKKLAHNIAKQYHSEAEADMALQHFVETFSKKDFPDNAPQVHIGSPSVSVFAMVKACMPEKSNSDVRRLIAQNAVTVQQQKKNDEKEVLDVTQALQVKIGKLGFFKVMV